MNILCFGDSNTYGYMPAGKGRYNEQERYPKVLEKCLGKEFKVIEDGVCGRTTIFDKGDFPSRKGIDTIKNSVLKSKADILILMLGTNDCKKQFNANADDISKGVIKVAQEAQKAKKGLQIIICCPVRILSDALGYVDYYNINSIGVSSALSVKYKQAAAINSYEFVNANDVTAADIGDGEHMNANGHKLLAYALSKKIKSKAL